MALAGSPEGVEGGGGRTSVCPTRLTDSPVCENCRAGSSLGGFGSRLISDLSRVQLPPAQLQPVPFSCGRCCERMASGQLQQLACIVTEHGLLRGGICSRGLQR